MFIGRKKELNTLNDLFNSNKFEFVVIYGRRRVGKTSLINKFIDQKEVIYFTGIESNEKQNLENFSNSIFEYYSGIESDNTFSSFQTALEFVFKLSENKRIILVIDEYPYVAHASKSLASTLQLLIDKYKDTSKLMLILCGSSMSYMEDQVLAYKAPLYGRRTSQMKILPFEFEETCEYTHNMSDEDKAFVYGIVGGTPQYLLQFNSQLSVEENIKNNFLNPNSFLYEEPTNLLKQEVREPAIYTSIIFSIANGASKLSEISNKVGENTNVCSSYLKNLINLGIIKKEAPYNDDSSRKFIYSIDDNMFRFWYRFVLRNHSIITKGAVNLAYQRIKPFLNEYMGLIFEEICKQYLWKQLLNNNCPVEFSSLGRWWGNDPIEKKQVEIDIMGEEDKYCCLFGECKWTNEKVDVDVLNKLIKRTKLFHYTNNYIYIFSKSGFTNKCKEEALKLSNIYLITYNDILNSFNK